MPTPESIFIELRRLAEDESMEPYKAQTLIDAAAALEDMAQVLRMVDDNQRVDDGEDRKAWRGSFVVAEVRRVLGDA